MHKRNIFRGEKRFLNIYHGDKTRYLESGKSSKSLVLHTAKIVKKPLLVLTIFSILIFISAFNGVAYANTVTATIPVGNSPIGVATDFNSDLIYVSNQNDNTISVIDGTTNTVTATVPVGNTPIGVAVNSNTNLIYVSNFDDDTVSVIDGTTNTVTATVPVGDGPFGIAVNSNTNLIYVVNLNDNTISVIDGTTNTVTATVPVGSGPRYVSANIFTDLIYVSNFDDNTISVIDGTTNTVTATVTVGSGPIGVAVNSNTNLIYVVNINGNTVSVIDGTTNLVTATVPVGTTPRNVSVNSNTNLIYVSNIDDDTVSVIDGTTNLVTDTVPVGDTPFGVSVNSNTNLIYVVNLNDNTISVIVGTTDTVPVGDTPFGVSVNSNTNLIYVVNLNDNTISVIDGTTNTVTATIPVGNSPIGVATDFNSDLIYVSNQNDNTISVIDGTTNTVTATIPVGNTPIGVATDFNSDLIYVSNFDDDTVSVIDGTTNTVTATVPVGDGPFGIAVNSNTNLIYVVNLNDNTISVIDGTTNTVTATVTVGSGPRYVSANIFTDLIYVSNFDDNTISVIDGTTNTVTATVTVGSGPIGVAVNSNTNLIYVVNINGNTVSVIDGTTNTVTDTVPVGTTPRNVSVNSNTNLIYVSNINDDTVSVIDGTPPTTLKITKQSIDGADTFHIQNINSTGTQNHFLTTLFGGYNSESVNITAGEQQSLSEIVPTGWTLVGQYCSINGVNITGNVTTFTPSVGDDVVCKFTNEIIPPTTLKITKQSIGDTGTFEIQNTNSTGTQSHFLNTIFGGYNSESVNITAGEQQSLSEIVPTGWTLVGQYCSINGVNITGNVTTFTPSVGDDVVCKFTNEIIPPTTLKITKQSIDGADTFHIQNINSTGTQNHFLTTLFGGYNSESGTITAGEQQSLSEIVPTGWTLVGQYCSINGVNITGNVTTFTPSVGDDVVCKFTNEIIPPTTLKITKQSIGDTGTFEIQNTNSTGTQSHFLNTIFGGYNSESVNITAGEQQSLSEIVPTGWTLVGQYCSINGVNITGNVTTFTPSVGDDVVCKFTNEIIPPTTLKITKQSIGDTGTFEIQNTNSTGTQSHFLNTIFGGYNSESVNITAGEQQSLSEIVPTGWTLVGQYCSINGVNITGNVTTFTPSVGDDVVCKFTNEIIPPTTLKITKQSIDGADTFHIQNINSTGTQNHFLTTLFGGYNSESGTITAGEQQSLSEIVPTGWTLVGQYCSINGVNITGNVTTFTPSVGDDVVCKFTNEIIPPTTLKITKQSIGDTGTFEIQNTNSTGTQSHFLNTIFGGGYNSESGTITAGEQQSLSEIVPTGWTLVGQYCSINGVNITGNVTTFTPSVGDDVVCKFTNEIIPPTTLKITKQSIDGADTFHIQNINSTGTQNHFLTTLFGGYNSESGTITAGEQQSLSEIVPTGWTLVGQYCSINGVNITGNVTTFTPSVGDDVVCKFTNEIIPPTTLKITKQSIDGADTFHIQNINSTGTQNHFLTTLFGGYNSESGTITAGEQQSLSEIVPTGWTLVGQYCSINGVNITGNVTTFTPSVGDDVVCKFTNEIIPPTTLKITKQSIGDTGTFEIQNTNSTGTQNHFLSTSLFFGYDSESGTITAGEQQSLSEIVPTGWTLVGQYCSINGVNITGNVTTFTPSVGDDVVCKFTNELTTVELAISNGILTANSPVSEASLPTAGKPAITFPHGFVTWTVDGLSNGETISIDITYPTPIPMGAQYWKVIGGVWIDATSILSDDDGDNILTLTITDGGPFDADGIVNGEISDPGAVSFELNVITSDITGNQNVGSGEILTITNGATVTGKITVDGGTLILEENCTIIGNVKSINGGNVSIDSCTINGHVITIGGDIGITNDSTVTKNVNLKNSNSVSITNNLNSFNGHLRVDGAGTVTITDNTVDKNISVKNSSGVTINDNQVGNNLRVLDNDGVTVNGNHADNDVDIKNNTACTHSGNTADNKVKIKDCVE